jgi:uncharacterized membrane protein
MIMFGFGFSSVCSAGPSFSFGFGFGFSSLSNHFSHYRASYTKNDHHERHEYRGHHNDSGHQWGHNGSCHDHTVVDDCGTGTSVDSTILAGTTNTDSTGSSVNLTLGNASLSLIGDGTATADGVILTHTTDSNGSAATSVTVDDWNQVGFKELKVNNADDFVSIDGVVDVDLVNTGNGAVIEISDIKRGQIETGCGDDTITLSVYSNDPYWGHNFTIDSGAGSDVITMTTSSQSQYTSFDIDAGKGDDSVDVSGLSAPHSSSVVRIADGGAGVDTLTFSGSDTLSFENFEVIKGVDTAGQAALTLGSALLAANDDARYGLVLSNVDVSFDSSVQSYDSSSLSCREYNYLDSLGLDASDFVSIAVTTDHGVYDILTDDVASYC